MNKRTFKDLLRREALGGGASLPRGAVGKWLVRDGLVDSIGISIADKPNVRAEIWALLFDEEDDPYTDEQRITNIEASAILNNGLELGGSSAKGYFVYPEDTAAATLRKAYGWAGVTSTVTDLDGNPVFGTPDIGAYEYI